LDDGWGIVTVAAPTASSPGGPARAAPATRAKAVRVRKGTSLAGSLAAAAEAAGGQPAKSARTALPYMGKGSDAELESLTLLQQMLIQEGA
jgi:hypothetical protein